MKKTEAARQEDRLEPLVGLMRHWNYRVIEFVDPASGEAWRAIHEVHYERGVPTNYVQEPATIVWDVDEGDNTPVMVLQQMQGALCKPPLVERDFMKPNAN